MSSEARKTVSHAGIYALGNILRNAASFIMLPIYTRYLAPADYGVIELLSMLVDFVSIIFGMRLGEGIFRFYCNATTDQEKTSVISSALIFSIFLNGLGVLLVVSTAQMLSQQLFGDATYASYIRLFALTLLLEAVTAVPMVYVRAQQRPWLFITFNIIKMILQLSLNIYFIVIKDLRVDGVIYSALISGSVMACMLTGYTLYNVGIRISYRIFSQLVRFSVPLVFATMGSFYLTFGDRYFLRLFGNLSDVGIYALGYKFGFMLLVLMWDPFEKIWDTQRYELYQRPDARGIFQRTFVIVSILMLSAALGISLFVKDLLRIMSAPAFQPAHAIVPIILVAYVMQAWTSYCSFGLLLKQKTSQIAYGTTIGAVAITFAYLTLIPLYGVYGAAWATVIGFAARLYWIQRKSTLEYDMQLPWKKIAVLCVLAIGIYLLSMFTPDEIIMSLLTRALLLALFFVIFMLLPILSENEKSIVIAVLKDPRKIKYVLA